MPKWTPDQQTAIDDRGGALLVSAAAGSGKTAVLTERVLRRLTDENDPVDIDRLLLVTFTNAAAAEMRERIGAALGAAVAANPRDTRLRRQLFLVHRAKITTVHALCLSLAREQAAVLGIAPDFRLMDENEGKLLRASPSCGTRGTPTYIKSTLVTPTEARNDMRQSLQSPIYGALSLIYSSVSLLASE